MPPAEASAPLSLSVAATAPREYGGRSAFGSGVAVTDRGEEPTAERRTARDGRSDAGRALMTTQEQQSAAGDELRMLRARAYGPDADIEDDPAALRRLRELEEQGRPEPAGVVGTAVSSSTETVTAIAEADAEPVPLRVRSEPAPGDAAPEAQATDVDPAPPEERRPSSAHSGPPSSRVPWWRRTRTLWIASVVVAAVATAAVTLAVSESAAGRVAVLNVDWDADWPDEMFAPEEGSLVFEEFHGVVALVAPQDWNEGEQLDCLYVRALESGAGPSTGGCSGGTFPPTAGMVVAVSSPDALRERFADGTALQFVARGSQVHVYADEP